MNRLRKRHFWIWITVTILVLVLMIFARINTPRFSGDESKTEEIK